MVARPTLETVAILGITIAVPTAAALLSPSTAFPTLAGVVGGIPGVLVAWLISIRQRPVLCVSAVPGGTIGQQKSYWVHLLVDNLGSGFLGAGTAHGVQARLTLPNGRVCDLKWSSKPDPIEIHPVGPPSPTGWFAAASVLNPHLFESAKTETIRPHRSKDLGIAFKISGDPNAYVHEPENFRFPDWRNPQDRLPPGPQPISLTLEYDEGEAGPFRFVIRNDGRSTVSTQDSKINLSALSVSPE
jgi:hypothetical protein